MPEPIFNAGPVATPYAYTVSGTGTVTPRACQADFDGSGAGGDFIPACIFKSQSGHVISRAILQSTITAGDDAEVSWFPGVSPASTGTAGSVISYASGWRDSGRGDTNLTFAAGAQMNIPFLHTSTSNPAVMSWATAANPFDRLNLNAIGLYIVYWSGNLTIDPTYAFFLVSSAGEQLQHASLNTNSAAGSSVPQEGIATNQDYSVFNVTTGSPTLRAYVQNNTLVNQTGFAFYLAATYLGVPA
jgi:hypothetical protein